MKTQHILKALIPVTLLASSQISLAGHEYHPPQHSQTGNYGDYADVINVTPAYSYDQVSVPRQQCRNVPDNFRGHDGNPLTSTTGQTVIGGIIGAALGNQIGDGRGKDIATVAGGLIGASIGANRANTQQRQHGPSYRRQCDTVYSNHSQRRQDGYDVTYRYAGRTYHTRLPYHPGNRMRVNVDVQPEHSGSQSSYYNPRPQPGHDPGFSPANYSNPYNYY